MELALADKSERGAREAALEKKLSEAERAIGRVAREDDLLGKASRRLM
jgi:hypothetical protein